MTRRLTRRAVLAGAGAGAAGLAGCLGGGSGQSETCAESLPRPYLGAADADVTVTVFEDYACPHCRTFARQVAPRLKSEYAETDRVRHEFYDFPIPVDEQVSWQAASAARAVQDRAGREAFFTYKRRLFDDQGSLSPATYEELAEGLTDGGPVREAAETRCYDPVVEADRQAGRDRGVQGTPTVFVNDQRLVGPDFATASDAVEASLSRNG